MSGPVRVSGVAGALGAALRSARYVRSRGDVVVEAEIVLAAVAAGPRRPLQQWFGPVGLLWSEGIHDLSELVGSGPRRGIAGSMNDGDDDAPDHGDHDGHSQEEQCVGHGRPPVCWASATQLEPPDQISRFQIGTVAFSVSMP